jgi:N-acetylglucosaminyldiphosphoundecaprenol N-acetyl-beta-D-mannosaminyltransferase
MNVSTSILGTKFSTISEHDLLHQILFNIKNRTRTRIAFANTEFVMKARRSITINNFLKKCDFVLPDGIGIVWSSLLTNNRLNNRITGTDFSYSITKLASDNNLKLFLYGTHYGTRDNVVEQAANKLKELYPNCAITFRQWYIEDGEDIDAIKYITAASPDVLMVCNNLEDQIAFVQREELDDIPLVFPNGGAIDFVAGRVKRAPIVMQKLGFEWLWRMFQNFTPRRVWRQVSTIPVFMYYVIIARLRGKL